MVRDHVVDAAILAEFQEDRPASLSVSTLSGFTGFALGVVQASLERLTKDGVLVPCRVREKPGGPSHVHGFMLTIRGYESQPVQRRIVELGRQARKTRRGGLEGTTENEYHKLDDSGQPELHIFRDGEGEYAAWLNTGVSDFDGMCIGTGTTRQEAAQEATHVAEKLLESLQGPPAAYTEITPDEPEAAGPAAV